MASTHGDNQVPLGRFGRTCMGPLKLEVLPLASIPLVQSWPQEAPRPLRFWPDHFLEFQLLNEAVQHCILFSLDVVASSTKATTAYSNVDLGNQLGQRLWFEKFFQACIFNLTTLFLLATALLVTLQILGTYGYTYVAMSCMHAVSNCQLEVGLIRHHNWGQVRQ